MVDHIEEKVPCSRCSGSGRIGGMGSIGGLGGKPLRISAPVPKKICPDCGGTGWMDAEGR